MQHSTATLVPGLERVRPWPGGPLGRREPRQDPEDGLLQDRLAVDVPGGRVGASNGSHRYVNALEVLNA